MKKSVLAVAVATVMGTTLASAAPWQMSIVNIEDRG